MAHRHCGLEGHSRSPRLQSPQFALKNSIDARGPQRRLPLRKELHQYRFRTEDYKDAELLRRTSRGGIHRATPQIVPQSGLKNGLVILPSLRGIHIQCGKIDHRLTCTSTSIPDLASFSTESHRAASGSRNRRRARRRPWLPDCETKTTNARRPGERRSGRCYVVPSFAHNTP